MKPRAALAAVILLALAGCAPSTPGQVVVSAASSLTDAFTELEQAFEEAHPGVDVVLNLGGSSGLRLQILEGAPIDVFASANIANMDRVAAEGLVDGTPQIFAHNRMQIAVPSGNPAGVIGLADFANEELLIGLCAAAVPCGELAATVLEIGGIIPAIDTSEPDVRSLLTKVEVGELDAALVYATDVASAGAVDGIEISDTNNAVAAYSIARLTEAPNPSGAAAFVDLVLSDAGQAILTRHGFASP